MKKDPLQPAKARSADAGKKKKRGPMTDAEKLNQKHRLIAMDEKEMRENLTILTKWIAWWMNEKEYDKDRGPLSVDEMNGDPVKVLCTECYLALWEGDWRWDENRKLSSQLIWVARSKIAHILRDYCKKKQPLAAPSDVKRYFVSPEESGQICMLACILGRGGEVFFPKLGED